MLLFLQKTDRTIILTILNYKYAGIAQSVEQHHGKVKVVGSIPISGIKVLETSIKLFIGFFYF